MAHPLLDVDSASPADVRPTPVVCDLLILQRATAFGGAERHTIDLIRHLTANGWTVALVESGSSVISHELRDLDTRLRVVTTNLPMEGLSSAQLDEWRRILASQPAARALLAKTFFYVADLALLDAIGAAFPRVFHLEHTSPSPRRPWSPDLHFNGRPRTGLWWYKDALSRWRVQRTAGRMIAVSEGSRQRLIKDGLVAKHRVVTCPNGVNTQLWQRDLEAGRAFRKNYGIPEDAYLFGCVGRLSREKGLDLAIRAFADLLERSPEQRAFLCLVGDGECRDELEALAAGLTPFVRFTGQTRAVAHAYSAIDTVLSTTGPPGESFGLVLAEAMACGCSVIAAGFGGVPEVVSDPTCGTLLTTLDTRAWSDAMLGHMMRSPEERRQIGLAARAFVQRNHEQGTRLARLLEVLQ